MPDESQHLGGRIALFAPDDLTGQQRKVYDVIDQQMVPWAEKAGFKVKLPDGRLVGPFNPILLSPEMGEAFLTLQAVEGKHSSLSPRVRQVVILTVGAVCSVITSVTPTLQWLEKPGCRTRRSRRSRKAKPQTTSAVRSVSHNGSP